MRPTLLLFLFLLSTSFLLPCSAGSCAAETFSENRLYSLCTSLPELSATLHWTYHPTNGTADVAYRVTQTSSGWAGWAINPNGSGMLGANAFLAFHDASSGAVDVITTVIAADSNYSPTIQDENLTFAVYSRAAEYSGGAYTIYATVALPGNDTAQSTAWQAGSTFQNGLPYGHPTSGANVLSKSRVNFLSGQASAAGSSSRLHRKNIHGVLNAVSWGLLLPLGVIIARYLRVFKSADPAWFYLHIACQCSGYILGVAGWALGLKLGSESKGITYHAHRYIGIVLFCLATLQLSALLLRPDKKNKFRSYWNVFHHSVGYSVVVLGVANVFKGFGILNPAHKWKHAYIGVVATLVGVAAVLEVVTWTVVLKRRSRSTEADKSHHDGPSAGYGARQYQTA